MPHLARWLLFATNTQRLCARLTSAAPRALRLACRACCAHESALQTGKALQAPDDQFELPSFSSNGLNLKWPQSFLIAWAKAGTIVAGNNSYDVT